MLDTTNETHQEDTNLTDAERLVRDLVEVFRSEQKTLDKAEHAKEQAQAARENSIKALADRLHGLNHDLEPEVIEAVSESAAEKIAGKNKGVLKVRKSEIKLLLESHNLVKPMIDGLEKYRSTVQQKDPKYTLNLRTTTLASLRRIRKDSTLTVRDILRKLEEDRVREVDEGEKARKLLDKLLDSPAIRGVTAAGREFMDPRAQLALETLRTVLEEGPMELNAKDVEELEGKLTAAGAVSEGERFAPGEELQEVLSEFPDRNDGVELLSELGPDAGLEPDAETEASDQEPEPDLSGLDIDIDSLVNT